jgi:ATP-binding cassette subfamily B protein
VGEAFRRRHHELYGERIALQRLVARHRLLRLMGSNAVAAVVAGGLIAAILGITGSGGIHIADIVITAAALQRLGASLGQGFSALRTLDEARPYLDDLEHLLASVPEASAPGRAEPLPPLQELRCEGLRFRYPTGDADVLTGLDLVIRPGTVTAVLGENGIGKTTLAKLLCGLYAPTGGRITWNGQDVAELGRERLAASTAMLFQDFSRYRMTVRHNVGAGDVAQDPVDAVVDPALRAASAKDLVDELPERNDTVLGVTFEGGTDLSSGQWQRLALARALFRTDAQLLVLDEPTASMDAKTERAVFDSLRSWASGRAVVVITHRPLEDGLVDEVLRPPS